MKEKIIMLMITLIGLVSMGYSQEKENISFRLIDASSNNLTSYVTAVENSDFECYRFKSERRILKFDTGIVLELFSADEVEVNTQHQSNCFLADGTVTSSVLLKLGESNNILMEFDTNKVKFKSNSEK